MVLRFWDRPRMREFKGLSHLWYCIDWDMLSMSDVAASFPRYCGTHFSSYNLDPRLSKLDYQTKSKYL